MNVYIDESGTLPDPKDMIIVLAAVGVTFPKKIEKIMFLVRKKTKLRKKFSELKFYTSGQRTKQVFFEKISNETIDIFIIVIEKGNQKIKDTPENFAILCWLLLKDLKDFYVDVDRLIFDRHFSRKKDILEFNDRLSNLIGDQFSIEHVDSSRDTVVNVADMVAGATLSSETGKDNFFLNRIKQNIVSYKKISWKNIKRNYIKEKLARTGAGTHPKQVI